MTEIPLFSSALSKKVQAEILYRLPHARFLPTDPALPAPICHHPDTLVCTIPGYLFLPQDYYRINTKFFDDIAAEAAVTVCPVSTPHGDVYPADAAYNGVICGRYFIGKISILAPEISAVAEKCGYTLLSVRQGYAACSTIVLGEALFTSDLSILRAVDGQAGIMVTPLDPFPITLPGYNCGFPGGTCGLVGDTLYWFGTPDSLAITPIHDHCQTHGIVECVLWERRGVVDCGGIRVVRGINTKRER